MWQLQLIFDDARTQGTCGQEPASATSQRGKPRNSLPVTRRRTASDEMRKNGLSGQRHMLRVKTKTTYRLCSWCQGFVRYEESGVFVSISCSCPCVYHRHLKHVTSILLQRSSRLKCRPLHLVGSFHMGNIKLLNKLKEQTSIFRWYTLWNYCVICWTM